MNAERLEEIRGKVESAGMATVPLLTWARWYYEDVPDLLAEVESLQARIAVLMEALERFGDVSGIGNEDDFFDAFHEACLKVDDLLADLPAAVLAHVERDKRMLEALEEACYSLQAWMDDARDGDLSPPVDDDYRALARLRTVLAAEGGTDGN